MANGFDFGGFGHVDIGDLYRKGRSSVAESVRYLLETEMPELWSRS